MPNPDRHDSHEPAAIRPHPANSHHVRELQDRMVQFLLANALIALAAPLLIDLFGGAWDYGVGFVAGAVLLSIADRRYGRYLWYSSQFVLYLLWEIVLSNISMAWLVVQPKPKLDPGIVGVPLTIRTGLEITALATAITLTPGTISVDLDRDEDGRCTLYVHALRVGDPDQFRRSIQQGFERMILRISHGVA